MNEYPISDTMVLEIGNKHYLFRFDGWIGYTDDKCESCDWAGECQHDIEENNGAVNKYCMDRIYGPYVCVGVKDGRY